MLVSQSMPAGSVIRVVAPCGVFSREDFEVGVKTIRAFGFEVRFDEGIFSRGPDYLAGDDVRRNLEFEAALQERDTRAIWVARGGYGATRLLPHLSEDLVRSAAKWLIGFSDVTALHCLWNRAGVASIHGPNVTTIASWQMSAQTELFSILNGTLKMARHRVRMLPGANEVSGQIVGGNLTVLASMVGTGTLPSFSGKLVFLEDVGERPYRLDRSVTQLIQSGVWDDVAGFVVGQLTNCEDLGGENRSSACAFDVVTGLVNCLGRPVMGPIDVGHEPSSRSIMLGATGQASEALGELLVDCGVRD